MIVDAGGIGNAPHHLFEQQRNTIRGHSWMEFLRFWRFISNRLHRKMQHNFEAAAMGFLGDVDGMRVIGQDGDGQRKRQGKYGIANSSIVA